MNSVGYLFLSPCLIPFPWLYPANLIHTEHSIACRGSSGENIYPTCGDMQVGRIKQSASKDTTGILKHLAAQAKHGRGTLMRG